MLIDWKVESSSIGGRELRITFIAKPCEADPESDKAMTLEEIEDLTEKAQKVLNTWAHVDRASTVVIEQNVDTVEAGATFVGVKIDRIG